MEPVYDSYPQDTAKRLLCRGGLPIEIDRNNEKSPFYHIVLSKSASTK